MWSGVVSRGKTLRLTDLEGGANVGMLLYNADCAAERYNMPDTLKGQHIFYLRHPYCLHSDMGRVLASLVTEDTAGWHDTVCGCSDARLVAEKYGVSNYQTARNEFYRNARDCFLIELAKWGLSARDLVPNLNLFSKVVADEAGKLSFVPGHSPRVGRWSFGSKWTRWWCSMSASIRSIPIRATTRARSAWRFFAAPDRDRRIRAAIPARRTSGRFSTRLTITRCAPDAP